MAISTVSWLEVDGLAAGLMTDDSIAILLFNESERKVAEGVVHRMVKRAVEMEGTVTGEHGVGLIKRDYLNHELGASTVDAMRRVSLCIDGIDRVYAYIHRWILDEIGL